MIVNNEQQAQGAPIKPPVSTEPQNNQPPRPEGEFNPKLTYSWLHSLSEENGSKLTEEDILRYSKENVADNFLDIYAKVGAPLPEPAVLDSIYESFFEIPEVETVPPVEKKRVRNLLPSWNPKSLHRNRQWTLRLGLLSLQLRVEKIEPQEEN